MFISGLRALLLQSLHPAAMRAVAEHSGYRGDLWGRLARTSTFLAMTTFGHPEDARAAVGAVRHIHERVTGTMPDGTPYRASDPHLLGWVHIAEIDSFLTAHQVYGARPLNQIERDQYVAQTAEVARRLGVVDPPLTELELRERVQRYRPELQATPEAREAISYLLFHPPLPPAGRPAYAVLVAAAIGLMPRWSRRPLDLPWLPVTEYTVVRGLGKLATKTIRWALATPPESEPLVQTSSRAAPEGSSRGRTATPQYCARQHCSSPASHHCDAPRHPGRSHASEGEPASRARRPTTQTNPAPTARWRVVARDT